MSLKYFLIRVILVIMSVISTSAFAVERLFWDKVPLRITLPVGKERLVVFLQMFVLECLAIYLLN